MAFAHNIGIQMNRKKLAKKFTMISNWKNLLVSMVYTKNIPVF